MKQSEMKAKVEAERAAWHSYQMSPMTFTRIKCKNKKYDGACGCCWVCEKCGRSGCDNLIGFRPEIDTLVVEECDLEEG